jgi:DNA-directed RNA polymerase specialized sigma24 family protein
VIKINISKADLSALVELLREVGITEAMQAVSSTAPVTTTHKPKGSKVGVKRGKYNTKLKQDILNSLRTSEATIKAQRTVIREASDLLESARILNQELLIKARKHGIPLADIANALGISEGSVTSRYQTARKQARKRNTTK